jgi:hypothetical protein
MSEKIPSIFQSTVLRSRVVYNDVSKRTLTVREKTFLVNEALGISTLLTWGLKIFQFFAAYVIGTT